MPECDLEFPKCDLEAPECDTGNTRRARPSFLSLFL